MTGSLTAGKMVSVGSVANAEDQGNHQQQPPSEAVHQGWNAWVRRLFYYVGTGSVAIGVLALVNAYRTSQPTKDYWGLAAGLVGLGLGVALTTAIHNVQIEDAVGGLYLRRRILALDVDYLIVLFVLAFLYALYRFSDSVPDLTPILSAMWFAMLGSVAVSIKGISDWKGPAQWDEGWRLWYWTRPASGLIIGIVTYFALQAVSSGKPSTAGLVIVSFLFGMQEVRFFHFLSTVAHTFLSTPGENTDVSITGIEPTEGREGDVVVVTGTNIDSKTVVAIGGQELTELKISPAGTGVAGKVPKVDPGKRDVLLATPSGSAYVRREGFNVLSTGTAPAQTALGGRQPSAPEA